ncbi:MAG TPA: FkbM family methyltransferase [Nitrospirota bacterium]
MTNSAPQDSSRTSEPAFLNFLFKESFNSVLVHRFRKIFFKSLTKNSSSLFLRGRDIISINPQINGIHEPVITSLINNFADEGYSDFLVDIGANIGLISCQTGNRFKQVHMFEPNPYCCKILEVNTLIALNKTDYRINNYGLGDENKKCLLTVPRHNWGGAFIKDKSNSYDDRILANKDEFESIIDSNYFTVDIEIRKASEALDDVFKDLIDKNLTKGVIKIDVEGFEPTVLKGIAESIPPQLNALIIFESLDAAFDMATIVRSFNGRAIPYKLVRQTPWKNHWPKALKALALLFKPEFSNRIMANKDEDWSGNIILQID